MQGARAATESGGENHGQTGGRTAVRRELVHAQRMRGVDEGYAENALDPGRDIGGIGEMGMDHERIFQIKRKR